jgi:hypothetical protein
MLSSVSLCSSACIVQSHICSASMQCIYAAGTSLLPRCQSHSSLILKALRDCLCTHIARDLCLYVLMLSEVEPLLIS